MTDRPTFKDHDFFMKDKTEYNSRAVFQEHVRHTNDKTRELRDETEDLHAQTEVLHQEMRDYHGELDQVIEGNLIQTKVNERVEQKYNDLDQAYNTQLNGLTAQLALKASKREVSDMVGNIADGTPLFANGISEMTDTTRIYLNISDGFLYVHDGNGFTNTGVVYLSNSIEEYMYYEGQGWSE